MNMNFIAFSSQAKLLDRPHLDAAAVGHRLLDAGVRLLPEHHVHVVLDKIYQADALDNPPAAGEWLRTPACRSEGAEIDNRDGCARKSAGSAGDVSGCGSTQYRLQSYVARRARSSAAMRR